MPGGFLEPIRTYGYVTVSGGFTIGGWWKRVQPVSGHEAFVTQYTQGSPRWAPEKWLNGRHFWFGVTPTGVFLLHIRTETGAIILDWTDPAAGTYGTDNEWHHIVLRLGADKRTWTIFVDGAVYYTTTVSAGLAADWSPGIMAIGAAYSPHLGNWGINMWKGQFGYFYVVNRELSDSRIQEHYTSGSGGTLYYGDNEVQRLNRLYDWANVPSQSREFEAPMQTLQGIEADDSNALDQVHEWSEAAGGYVFADGQSRMVYHNRRHRYNRWSLATLSESLGSAPEMNLTFEADERWVYNDIRGSRPYGTAIRVQNFESQAEYGRKVYELKIAVNSHEALRQTVSWLLHQYGKAHVRVSEVEFAVDASQSTVLEELSTGLVEVGDVITLDELPEEAPQPTMSWVVDGLGLNADFRDRLWRFRMRLTPNEFYEVFELGSSGIGTGRVVGW